MTDELKETFAPTIPDKLAVIWGFIMGDGSLDKGFIKLVGTSLGEIEHLIGFCKTIEEFLASHGEEMTIRYTQETRDKSRKLAHVCAIRGDGRLFARLLRDFLACDPFNHSDMQHSKWFELVGFCRDAPKSWEWNRLTASIDRVDRAPFVATRNNPFPYNAASSLTTLVLGEQSHKEYVHDWCNPEPCREPDCDFIGYTM